MKITGKIVTGMILLTFTSNGYLQAQKEGGSSDDGKNERKYCIEVLTRYSRSRYECIKQK